MVANREDFHFQKELVICTVFDVVNCAVAFLGWLWPCECLLRNGRLADCWFAILYTFMFIFAKPVVHVWKLVRFG